MQNEISLSDTDIYIGQKSSFQLNAYVNGKESNSAVSWHSSSPKKISVSNGRISIYSDTSIGENYVITAVSSIGNSSALASCDVHIIDMRYSASDLMITPGTSKSISVDVLPESVKGNVTWSIAAPNTVTLQPNGNSVKISVASDAVIGNTYVLTATYGNFSKTLNVTIGNELGLQSAPGLYDEYGRLVASWDKFTMDVESDYKGYTSGLPDSAPYSVLSKYSDAKAIVLPSNVKKVGKWAFSECTALKYVVLSGVTDISDDAFYGCTNLKGVCTGNSLISIGSGTFVNCTSLTDILLPDSLTTIKGSAFQGCTSLSSVVMPDSVEILGTRVFNGCSGLISVVLSNKLTALPRNTFEDCTSLHHVVIPGSITTIENQAFYRCSSTALTDVVFKNPSGWSYVYKYDETSIPTSDFADPRMAGSILMAKALSYSFTRK